MATSGSSPRPPRKNWFERLLSLFSDVRAGEGLTVVLLFVTAFIMMGLYYILKPVREALILAQEGAVVKAYASAFQALAFIVVVPAYGAFAARVNRIWLLSGMTLFFISNLVVFIVLGRMGTDVGIAYYIWLGVFNFMVISQFWAFANDLYTEEQGQRLFPVVGIGATLGAWLGATASSQYFEPLGPYTLMMVASGLLGAFILLIILVNQRESGTSKDEADKAASPLSKEKGGFGLVIGDRFLLLLAFHVLLLNLVNTVGEFILGALVESTAEAQFGAGEATEGERARYIGAFYGSFFAWVNLAAFLIQSFVVSRLFKYIGVRKTLFVGPIISLITYGTTALAPVLNIVRIMKTAENSNDYSTNNMVRQALFLNTSRDAKYKAKAAIDTFFARTGDALQAVVVFVGTQLSFAIPAFAVVNVAIVGIWLFVATGIARQHKKIESTASSSE